MECVVGGPTGSRPAGEPVSGRAAHPLAKEHSTMDTMPANPTMPPRRFKEATRVLTSVLAPVEKRVLIWLAARMPARINSDHLTGLALAAMLGAGLAFWLTTISNAGFVLVVACLAINWFGDSLDGTLARVRGHERPRYGFYVDHVVDAVGIAALVGGMALSGLMTPVVALGFLVAYFLLSIEVYLATYAVGTFRISYFKVGPTELRILLAIGTAVAAFDPTSTLAGREFLLFDVAGVAAIAGLLATLAYSIARNTRALYRAEPLPGRVRR
jgi:phosphatidylglycerophosphate synthase